MPSDFVVPGDYDGDGKTDICVVRTVSNARTWFPLSSLNGSYKSIVWGASSGSRTQGDYDGDGKTDIAVWQPVSAATVGSQSAYYVLPSNGNQYFVNYWGAVGDISVNSYNVR